MNQEKQPIFHQEDPNADAKEFIGVLGTIIGEASKCKGCGTGSCKGGPNCSGACKGCK